MAEKKSKELFLMILFVLLVAFLINVWVTHVKTVEPDKDSKIESLEKIDPNDNIKIYVDEETGVNYLIYDSYGRSGITPRFNADGSLYVE